MEMTHLAHQQPQSEPHSVQEQPWAQIALQKVSKLPNSTQTQMELHLIQPNRVQVQAL